MLGKWLLLSKSLIVSSSCQMRKLVLLPDTLSLELSQPKLSHPFIVNWKLTVCTFIINLKYKIFCFYTSHCSKKITYSILRQFLWIKVFYFQVCSTAEYTKRQNLNWSALIVTNSQFATEGLMFLLSWAIGMELKGITTELGQ